MTVTMVVAYPKGANVDIEYYKSKHWPAIIEHWTLFGMGNARWMTVEGESSCPYELIAEVDWPNMAAFQKMQAELPAEIQQAIKEEVKNYCSLAPMVWFMEVKGAL